MKKVLGIALIGIALFSYADTGVSTPVTPEWVTPDAPVPSEVVKAEVLELQDGFVADGAKLRGLFAAIAQEIADNKNLTTVSQVAQLNEKAFNRYLPMVGFTPVPGLASRLDAFVLEGVKSDSLTPEVRKTFYDRFMALEWLAQGGRDG